MVTAEDVRIAWRTIKQNEKAPAEILTPLIDDFAEKLAAWLSL